MLLLDTHTLLWFAAGNPSLSAGARAAIEDSGAVVFVSAVTAWEIATKHRIGKLPWAGALATEITTQIESLGFTGLAISVEDGQRAGALPGPHKDPFDRLLAAQALNGDLAIISRDAAFDAFGVKRLW